MKQALQPGRSTASPFNVSYRVGRIASYVRGGDWLDYGCADGAYTAALVGAGARSAMGVDVLPDRVFAARDKYPEIPFQLAVGDGLALPDCSVDGVLMNEVFEHVLDEGKTLAEVRRVLRPGGHLVLISPNRGFPFEGHTIVIGGWTSRRPTPLVPWLPRRLTDRWVTARNYWPAELRRKVAASGLRVVTTEFVMPVFEEHPWIPPSVARAFRLRIPRIQTIPGLRRLGVSNLIIAQRE